VNKQKHKSATASKLRQFRRLLGAIFGEYRPAAGLRERHSRRQHRIRCLQGARRHINPGLQTR